MGKKSRTKGATGELEVVNLLGSLFPSAARELEQYQGALGRDLRNTQPFCIQIKRHAVVSRGQMISAYLDAFSAADDEYTVPVSICRGDRQPWTVTWTLEDLSRFIGFCAGQADHNITFDMNVVIHMEGEEWVKWVERMLAQRHQRQGEGSQRSGLTEGQSVSGCRSGAGRVDRS